MNLLYIKKLLETVFIKAASQFPHMLVSEPRQSGKTILLQQLFGNGSLYVSLELPDLRDGELHHVQMGRLVVTPCG